MDRRTLTGEIQDRLPRPHVPGLASVPRSQPALNEVRALSHSVTIHGETLTRAPPLDLHASPFPGPDASGLGKRHSRPPHPPDRLEGWTLSPGQAGAAGVWGGRQLRPWSQPVPSSPPPPLPRTPGPGSQRNGIPPAVPPHLAGEGEGSRPRQAWGEIPRPLPLGPTPPSPLISQQRPPAAPRAWGEASAGAWESAAGREGRGRRWGGPEPQSPRCLAPQSSLPTPHQTPPCCPAWKDLSPRCQYAHSPCLSWKTGGSREDSRKPRVLVVVGPLKTSAWKSVPQAGGLPKWY